MFDLAATLPLAFWLLAIVATLLFGMSKAGFGGAADSLGVPPMALAEPAPFAPAVMLPILLLIGIEAVTFALDRFSAARSSESAVASAPTFGPGIFWSGLAGFTSYISHAGGPPITRYLMPRNMHKMCLVGTTVIFFTAVNSAKLGPYFQLNQIDLSNLGVSLLLAPVISVGYVTGYRRLQAVDMRGFKLVTAWTLLAAGAKLVYDGITG